MGSSTDAVLKRNCGPLSPNSYCTGISLQAFIDDREFTFQLDAVEALDLLNRIEINKKEIYIYLKAKTEIKNKGKNER